MKPYAAAAYACGMALIGAALLLGIFEPLAAMTRLVPLDPNEGWNAFFAQAAVGGGDLYPPPGSLIVNNYPPLSFFIVGALGWVFGDNIFAGRWVALLSMTAVAVNLFLWLRATGSEARIAWLGAAVFAALAVTYGRPYAAINDPQWLAHAIMTTGLVVLWRGGASRGALAFGALILLTGGWTKHLLVPIPIAVTWWLSRKSRPALLAWMGWAALFLTVLSLLTWWRFGMAFFDSLRSARAYSVHQAIKETGRAMKWFAPIIAPSLLLMLPRLSSEKVQFAVAYLLVAALVAMAAAGGIGVDINAFFDLMIASSLCAALAVETLWETRLAVRWPSYEAGSVLVLLLGGYLGARAMSLLPGALQEYRGLDALEQETAVFTRLIAEQGKGRAACETPELCYWAKSPFTFDFFNYGQRLFVGAATLSGCASLFDGRTFPLLQLDPNKGRPGSFQLPAACNAVIERNFRPILTSRLGVLLVPRSSPELRVSMPLP